MTISLAYTNADSPRTKALNENTRQPYVKTLSAAPDAGEAKPIYTNEAKHIDLIRLLTAPSYLPGPSSASNPQLFRRALHESLWSSQREPKGLYVLPPWSQAPIRLKLTYAQYVLYASRRLQVFTADLPPKFAAGAPEEVCLVSALGDQLLAALGEKGRSAEFWLVLSPVDESTRWQLLGAIAPWHSDGRQEDHSSSREIRTSAQFRTKVKLEEPVCPIAWVNYSLKNEVQASTRLQQSSVGISPKLLARARKVYASHRRIMCEERHFQTAVLKMANGRFDC